MPLLAMRRVCLCQARKLKLLVDVRGAIGAAWSKKMPEPQSGVTQEPKDIIRQLSRKLAIARLEFFLL